MLNTLPAYDPQKIASFCQDNQISYLGVFGSYARGEQKPDRDIDLAVDINKPLSFFTFVDLIFVLEEIFNKKVDLVIRKDIRPILKPYIEQDLKPLYVKN